MFELRLLCPEDRVETLSDTLEEWEALSVSVEDADAHTDAETPMFGEPGMSVEREGWQRSFVLALFDTEEQAHTVTKHLQEQDFFADCQVLGVQNIPDQDWVRLTQSQFAPVEVTPTFWIVPSWHEPPEQAEQIIRLDPGLAFGTGSHPTTHMCLRWLAQSATQADLKKVLDYGCGSGILAIGALKCGAKQVDAVDIDPAAVESTQLNAQNNSVQIRAGLPDLVDPSAQAYQTVIANILATPLKVLAPLLCSHLAPQGNLVLAGILERQTQELQEAYAPWIKLEVADTQDGWVLLTGKRNA